MGAEQSKKKKGEQSVASSTQETKKEESIKEKEVAPQVREGVEEGNN